MGRGQTGVRRRKRPERAAVDVAHMHARSLPLERPRNLKPNSGSTGRHQNPQPCNIEIHLFFSVPVAFRRVS
jgi:hypothetical protein